MPLAPPCTIAPLIAVDRPAWERLARAYHDFYRETIPQAAYDATWIRLLDGSQIEGVGAHRDGELVGIAHFLFHHHVWQPSVCYMQDLFVDPARRGLGIGRSMILQLGEQARERGAFRLYGTTAHDNAPARRLYDQVAQLTDFIRYDRAL
jgi:GNAT superfamily N-acetyltransferase